MHSCLVVGGAPTEHRGLDQVLEVCHFDAIFAVDGGYAPLSQRGVIPQGVFGDFDSLGYIPSEAQARTNDQEPDGASTASSQVQIEVFDSHKDFTDMDWALNHAAEQGFTNIVMCDGLHKRLDHSLGNLQLMAYAANHGQRIWGITEDEVVVTLDSAGGLTELTVDEGATGVCSVISHSDEATGVTEEGMEYGLENAHVSNRALWGISNELITSPARISLRAGSMWVFLPLKEIGRISYAGVKLA